jgi:DNA-binding IclR family transcriptional regulator
MMRRNAVKSVSRTLEVLELFEDQRRPLRLKDIYELLQYPQSSATNLLKSMVMMGYLNYSRSARTYLPTARVTALGGWLVGFMQSQTKYQALLEHVQRETDETVVLAMQNDVFIQYVKVLTPAHEFKVPPNEGTMRVLSRSSAGRALMSRMSDRKIDKLCRAIHYYELSGAPTLDMERFLKDIAWIRHVGYCYMPKHPVPEAASISFPLGDQLHGIDLAIGIGGVDERIADKQQQIVSIVRRAIEEFQAAEPAEEPDTEDCHQVAKSDVHRPSNDDVLDETPSRRKPL